MFSYFGGKNSLVHLYPKPLHESIIEPFCGAAGYSCTYFDHDVWINDLDPSIYGIWKYLRQASKQDIRSLPEIRKGESLKDCKHLSKAERDLLGFAVSFNVPTARFIMTGWAARSNLIRLTKNRLLKFVGKISHWTITNFSYDYLDNEKATWYIDPPYQEMGIHYRFKSTDIDFKHLGKWCRQRMGQVIVCEGGDADWLPFKPLRDFRRIRRSDRYKELIWYKSDIKTGFGLL